MEKKSNYPHTPIQLELPGLWQRFKLRWAKSGTEEKWRAVDGRNVVWLSPSYEAVFESECTWQKEAIGPRRNSKLIFHSCAEENQIPPGAEEMLRAIPEAMLQYLVNLLNSRCAVVTFENIENCTQYIINLDSMDLDAQKDMIIDAVYGAMDHELKTPGPYMLLQNGTVHLVPGSEPDGYPIPHKGFFWFLPKEDGSAEILSVKVPCDPMGQPLKDGDAFRCLTARSAWASLPPGVTRGQAFDCFPGGLVEIKNRRATVYCHPSLLPSDYRMMITGTFEIPSRTTRFIANESWELLWLKET